MTWHDIVVTCHNTRNSTMAYYTPDDDDDDDDDHDHDDHNDRDDDACAWRLHQAMSHFKRGRLHQAMPHFIRMRVHQAMRTCTPQAPAALPDVSEGGGAQSATLLHGAEGVDTRHAQPARRRLWWSYSQFRVNCVPEHVSF